LPPTAFWVIWKSFKAAAYYINHKSAYCLEHLKPMPSYNSECWPLNMSIHSNKTVQSFHKTNGLFENHILFFTIQLTLFDNSKSIRQQRYRVAFLIYIGGIFIIILERERKRLSKSNKLNELHIEQRSPLVTKKQSTDKVTQMIM